jgi:hypothetical protein
MDKTIAPTDTPQQKASRGIIEKLWRSPWKGMGTPEQKTNVEGGLARSLAIVSEDAAKKRTDLTFQFRFYQFPPQLSLLHTNMVSYVELYYFWGSRNPAQSMSVFRFTSQHDSQLHHGMEEHFDLLWQMASTSFPIKKPLCKRPSRAFTQPSLLRFHYTLRALACFSKDLKKWSSAGLVAPLIINSGIAAIAPSRSTCAL